jgi:hypothetical protein
MPNPNALRPEDRAIHDWYRFVLSFPPHLVRDCFALTDAQAGHKLLDPFAGTGTTLVEGQLHGMHTTGFEVNPVCQLAAIAKTAPILGPGEMQRFADDVAQMVADDNIPSYGLHPDAAALLIKGSISAHPLSEMIRLIRVIDLVDGRWPGTNYGTIARTIAASVAVAASNIKFRPNPTASGHVDNFDVLELWHKRMLQAVQDIQHKPRQLKAWLHPIDAREVSRGNYDRVVCSPPYPMEIDYSLATRLESVLLGFYTDRQSIQATKRRLVTSQSRGVYSTDTYFQAVADAPTIEALAQEIEAVNAHKTDGFTKQYGKIVREYFGGMRMHLRSLKPHLNDGARLAYVLGDQNSYGKLIKTADILGQLAEMEGYRVDEVKCFRDRPSKNGEKISENILLFRN